MGEVKPQDKDSGLVERSWVRDLGYSERTLEGEQVEATILASPGNLFGGLRHVAGTVCRNDAGELVVESWADGIRQETAVTRDANVDVKARPR